MSQDLGLLSTTIDATDMEELATVLNDGTIRPVIDGTYRLPAIADAVRHVENGHARGKVVIQVVADDR